MSKKIELWGFEGDETLIYHEMDDAIEGFLDGLGEDYLPATIEVQGYARIIPTVNEFRIDCVEHLLEKIDEDYGDPEEFTKATEEMLAVEEEFIEEILKLYESWRCECVYTETIDVEKWVKENAPHWLSSGDIKGFK